MGLLTLAVVGGVFCIVGVAVFLGVDGVAVLVGGISVGILVTAVVILGCSSLLVFTISSDMLLLLGFKCSLVR